VNEKKSKIHALEKIACVEQALCVCHC